MNTTNTVQIDNVTPDENGYVEIEMSLGATSLYAYLNSLVIKAYVNAPVSSSSATTSANVVTEAPSSFTAARAFPNPVQNDVTLNVPLSKGAAALSIKLTDASGSVLSTQTFTNVQQGTWQQRIPLQGKASHPGVYFIHIAGLPEGKTQVLKIVKVK
jgi:hypothetical protein